MLVDVRPEPGGCEHLLGPGLRRDVDVGNRSAQRAGVLSGDAIHVLRPGAGQLEDPADIRPWVGHDSRDDPRDVIDRDRRGAARPEREPDGAAVGNGARGHGRGQRIVPAYSWAKLYYRKAAPAPSRPRRRLPRQRRSPG